MGAPSKRAKKIRTADEFDVRRLNRVISPPKTGIELTSWSLTQIFAARDEQMRGNFYQPALLAEAMRTDDALFVAFENRLAPQRCIRAEIVPAKGARGAAVAAEAEALFGQHGVGIHPNTLASIHGCLVNHDVAFAQVIATPRQDGSRVDFELHYWPIGNVRWDSFEQCYKTKVAPNPDGSFEEVITHGDGKWVIFQRYEHEPFKYAVLLAAALVWARHAYAIRDWAKGSLAHGSVKVLGALPEGVPLQGSDGGLTEEASAMAELLRAFASSDTPAGLKPAGASVEFIANNSTAWQVWNELVLNAERAAARIYLGTDGTLGSQGGAPGVDIESLFGVAATRVESDLKAIERGIFTGLIEPWCAVNFGDSALSPKRKYLIPDLDADATIEAESKRRQAFYADIAGARSGGFSVTQEFVNELANKYDIIAPVLPEESKKAPSIALAPTDIARVVSVNEARASAGLGVLLLPDGSPDPDGALTVEEYSEKKKAKAAASAAAPVAPPPM